MTNSRSTVSGMPPLHPVNEFFRMMSGDELEELAESIKACGLLVPIILDKNGVLLDGKCRFRACQMAGVEPRFTVFEGDEEKCEALIISNNVHRYHHTPSQKAVMEAALATPGCYWEHRVLPEARVVVEHRDLIKEVMACTMTLAGAYQEALKRQEEAKHLVLYQKRLEEFRKAEPMLALQVDSGELTLDLAMAKAGEQAAAPVLAEHAERIRFLGRRMITDIIEIGGRLTECKALLGHGNWLPWLEREFGWGGETTALNFMRVYRIFGANPQQVADLGLPANVFYLLAAPSTPAVVREEVLERAQHERLSYADVRQMVSDTRPDQPHDRHQELRRLVDKMTRELPDDPLVEELRELLQRAKG